jgi:ribonuclease HI
MIVCWKDSMSSDLWGEAMSDWSGAVDVGYFDGSADPNPGGRMGMGWRLVLYDGSERTGAAEAPPAPGNTNNAAEYRALIALLREYLDTGGRGPLRVHGDSELIIRQLRGEYRVKAPGLADLWRQALALAAQIPGGVEYVWVPREENRVADQLASGTPAPGPRALTRAPTPPTGVPPALAQQIAALNQAGHASFKDCLRLRLGGTDAYSKLRLPELAARAGRPCAAVAEQSFPGADAEAIRARESALRWMLRGLAAQLAVRKVQVDRELSMRAQRP